MHNEWRGKLENTLDALNTGLELESNGIRFYTKALEEVRDPRRR
jgi:rubrerythrin